MTERLAGALFALFYLSGRFSLAESDFLAPHEAMLYEVRFWTLLALLGVTLTYVRPRGALWQRKQLISTRLAAALVILLPLYVAGSSLWSLDFDESLGKALEAASLALACICIAPFLSAGRVPEVRHGFWVALVATTGLMCLLGLVVVSSTRMSVLGGGPNTFGRNMGLLLLGSLYLQRRGRISTAWCWYPLMALSFLMVLLSGSRGALLATTVGGFIYLLIDHRYRKRNVLAIACLVILAQIVLLTTEFGEKAYEMFETRVVELTFEQQYTSGRDELFPAAYELGLESPWFGHGLSGFTIILGINYPHNIVLELFCETGIVGVSLLALLLLTTMRFVMRHRHHCDPAIWGAFGLALSSAMFSGDFFDSRGILLMAMLGTQEIVAGRSAKAPRSAPAGAARSSAGIYRPALHARP